MTDDLKGKNIIVYDIETDSLSTVEAKIKWFGAYSFSHDHYYILPFKGNEKEIKKLIAEHKILCGFNNKNFDNIILQNNFCDDTLFDYKVIIDLYEISAPKGGKEYGHFNKNKLAQMGIRLKNFTLKNIIEILKLDVEGGTKGEIDFTIFQKDDWTADEKIEIIQYLSQDVELTKKLFLWYHEQFKPLMKFLPQKDQDNFLYLKTSLAVLAYNIICNKAGLKVEYAEKQGKAEKYAGAHHIEPRWPLVRGQIYSIDAVSMYPNCLFMGNLHSSVTDEDAWTGDGYFKLDGRYDKKQQGKIESALKEIFLERLKAKQAGEKAKNLSYKIVCNSAYGTMANTTFKNLYNRNTASDITSMARTILKKACKTLNENGFQILSGFTDSIYVLVPPPLTKIHLMHCINKFTDEVKTHVPFPLAEFKFEIEEEMKMIWFVAKNCYLYVTNKNEVKYKNTLLNQNTPAAVMKLFKEYMEPIIIQTLDIPFKRIELENKLREILEKDIFLAAQEYKTTILTDYKVKTSLPYQITKRYGEGRHFLIPNKAGIGVGLQKSSKKKRGIRHCSLEEFKKNNLKISDVELKHLMGHLKPFYEKNEKVEENKTEQMELEI